MNDENEKMTLGSKIGVAILVLIGWNLIAWVFYVLGLAMKDYEDNKHK